MTSQETKSSSQFELLGGDPTKASLLSQHGRTKLHHDRQNCAVYVESKLRKHTHNCRQSAVKRNFLQQANVWLGALGKPRVLIRILVLKVQIGAISDARTRIFCVQICGQISAGQVQCSRLEQTHCDDRRNESAKYAYSTPIQNHRQRDMTCHGDGTYNEKQQMIMLC